MKKLSIFIFTCMFAVSSLGVSKRSCEDLLNWLYRDLTVEHFETSYERAFNKLLLGMLQVQKNSKRSFKHNKQMAQIFNALKRIEPEYNKYISPNLSVWLTNFTSRPESNNINTFSDIFNQWNQLQNSSPHLFKGLNKSHLLDDWDMLTIQNLEQIKSIDLANNQMKIKLEELQNELKRQTTNTLSERELKPELLQKNIEEAQKELMSSLNEKGQNLLDNYADICNQNEIDFLIQNEQYACPLIRPDNFNGLDKQLSLITSVLKKTNALETPMPTELIRINPVEYKKSNSPKSTYCKRPTEMMRMIVIHHTDTSEDRDPHFINQMHLDNITSTGEPWYMVGYNYMISNSFDAASPESPKVFQGRKDNIKGAHAGGYSAPLSESEKEFYSQFEIECGNDIIGMEKSSALTQTNEEGGISGNLISLGIAIIGDFSPFKYELIDGVFVPINADNKNYKEPGQSQIDATAKLVCKLQNEYPNLETIVPHAYFKRTDCPGSLIKYLSMIQQKAQEYGCNFNVKYTKAEGNK